MTKVELKKLIKEVLSETQFVNEGLPMGKSKEAQEAAHKLNYIVHSLISRPDLQRKGRVAAGDIIRLIDEDRDPNSPFNKP
jgi:hypothetical protein